MAGDTVRLQLKSFGKHPREKPVMTSAWRLSAIKKRKDWVLLLIKAYFLIPCCFTDTRLLQ